MYDETIGDNPGTTAVPTDEHVAEQRLAWVTPKFERLSLDEAMAGIRNAGPDLACS